MNKELEKKYHKNKYEYLAKLILEYNFPNIYMSLEKKECPDLQSNVADVGIEVVRVCDDEYIEGLKHFEKIITQNGFFCAKNNKKGKRIVFGNGYIISGVHDGNSALECIINIYNHKIECLNNNYKIFSKNEIFIFNELCKLGEADINALIHRINELSKQNTKKQFDFVHIKDGLMLYTISRYNDEVENRSILPNEMDEFIDKAEEYAKEQS